MNILLQITKMDFVLLSCRKLKTHISNIYIIYDISISNTPENIRNFMEDQTIEKKREKVEYDPQNIVKMLI